MITSCGAAAVYGAINASMNGAGETITITINGVAFVYPTVGADTVWNVGVANRIVGVLATIPAFTNLYNGNSFQFQTIVGLNLSLFAQPSDSRPSVAIQYIGAGELVLRSYTPTFVGGNGGANVSLNTGTVGANICVGGFISQTTTRVVTL